MQEPLKDLFSCRLCSRCRQKRKKRKKLAGEFQIHIGYPLLVSESLNIKIIQSGIQGMNCEGFFIIIFFPAEIVSVSLFFLIR